jgi:hypothetical protein
MAETMCCPLYGGDDEGPRVQLTRIRTARAPHTCSECDEAIAPGQRYEITTGCWDGSWSTYKTCMSCREIRNHFGCSGGWTYTEVWSQIESNFFPDMKAGGPCMEGLSPEAKARLFERRLAWLEADAEHAAREIKRAKLVAKHRSDEWWRRFVWMWGELGRAILSRDGHSW